jgi:excisionase family DNA binding protein
MAQLCELLTVKEAAALKRVTEGTVRRRIERNRLPAVKKGDIWLIRRVDLDSWIVHHGKGRSQMQNGHSQTDRSVKEARLREMQCRLRDVTPSVDQYLEWKQDEISQERLRDEARNALCP